jgi:dTDP-4-amino-4,6-dideoxygalactose transaminase
MQVPFSYLCQQFVDSTEILEKIKNHLTTCQFTLGPEVKEFESKFSEKIGVAFGLSVGSGTDALKIALRSLGIGPGDEVITAANTFIATVGAIAETGAKPVLADIGDDYTIDPNSLMRRVTKATKAVVPVHIAGCPANMDQILAIARSHDLLIVEDACQAIQARYKGANAGTFGHAAAFSLHPQKNLNVWGDGGIIVTQSSETAERINLLRNHGLKNRDEVETLGYNSRLDTIQAIVGNCLMNHLDEITSVRRTIASKYNTSFKEIPDITLPAYKDYQESVYHLYQMEVPPSHRDRFLSYLNENGIEAKVHYPKPLHLQKGLQHLGYVEGSFPRTEKMTRQTISLPLHQHLSSKQTDWVIEATKKFFNS